MKKTDVTQPVAMATPFAEGVYSTTSTDDFEIPAATSTTADDSCVMDDGFLPITSTALDDGGKAPERKNFNGMFYLSTDQRFFLQNGGFITYNPDVATAIGGYPQDAILDFIDSNGNYKKVRSLIDDNSNNFVADETLIDGTNWEEISMGGGSSRNIGEIVASSLPLTDAGLHILDGTLIDGNGIYSAFVDYIAGLDLTASLFCTEAEWQASVTQYGVCGKFVYDATANTVRLPKYSNQIYTQELDTTTPVVGNGMSLGLTDSISNFGISAGNTGQTDITRFYDACYNIPVGNYASSTASTNHNVRGVGVVSDSTSGLIADLSDITTSLDGYYYIVVATLTKTDIQVDIDEIATDLNNKVDKSDLAEVQCVVETYSNGTSWYRVYSDGWCEQGGVYNKTASGQSTITLLKSYANTNYQVLLTPQYSSNLTNMTALYSKATNSFIVIGNNNNSNYYEQWQACGYIEV